MSNRRHQRVIELVKEISSIIERGRQVNEQLRSLLADVSPKDVSIILDIHPEDRQRVYKCTDKSLRPQVLDTVNNHTLRSIVYHLSDHELLGLIENSPFVISQKVVGAIEKARAERLLPIIEDESRRHRLEQFANYPRKSVGRIMQPDLVAVIDTGKVQDAIEAVEHFDSLNGPIYQVYVVNKKEELVGVVPIADLLREPKSKKVASIIYNKPPQIRPQTTQARVAELFGEYDLIEAPVVMDKKLVGRVLVDDVLDIVEQEFADDLQKMAGITDEENMQTPALQTSRRRLPWMIVNIFLDLLAVSIIMPFEETIAQVTALAVIMPLVSDMGGNTGIQSLSVAVRALSSGRPNWRLAIKELVKELKVGTLNGFVLGAIVGVIAFFWWGNPVLGLIVAIALVLNTIVASIVGGMLPILLKKLNKDPAMMSGAILTTITDFFGFLLFLSLARAFIDFLV